jgi:hypothetical protein
MIVIYKNFPIFNSNGSVARVLDGEYEATESEDQQRGWYQLRKILANGSVDVEVAANVHIVGCSTT